MATIRQYDMEDRRDLDLAPPARSPAATSAAPPEPELGGPGSARDSARSDTQARRRGLRLLVTADTILRWHRNILRRRWAAQSSRGNAGRPLAGTSRRWSSGWPART